MRLGDCPILWNARRPTRNVFGCDPHLSTSTFPRSGGVFVQRIEMSSSGSQNQNLASQGKSQPPLVQSRRRMSKSSREPERNQTNAQTFDGSGSCTGAFSQSTHVSSSISALNTGLGGIFSTPNFRNIFSSVLTANQWPPPGQPDSLTDDFSSSVTDALMLPETSLMNTGGSSDVPQWGPLGTNSLAAFTSGTEASPGL